jgi:hypothetical protein
MLIYEKSVSFVRPNPKIGAKLAITDKLFNEDFRFLMPSLFLTLNVEPCLWGRSPKGGVPNL